MRWQEIEKNGTEGKLREMFPEGRSRQPCQILLKDTATKRWPWTIGFGKTRVFVTFGNNSFSGTVGWEACLRGFRRAGKMEPTIWCHSSGKESREMNQ